MENYSDFSYAIDLVMDVYKTTNPILISEKIEEDLGMEINIHQISDYLSLQVEDFEKENRKQYYNEYY